MDVSVIVCTHNPRPHYLRRVLEALRAQTFPLSRWELLLVDNASHEPLAPAWDLSWHPNARHLREEKLGVLFARAYGMRESRAPLMLTVDDDNLLAEDYLAICDSLMRNRPELGAIGLGKSVGEFEVPPPKEIEPYLVGLAIMDLKQDQWTNFGGYSFGVPLGAGMCFRRVVAEDYLRKLESNPLRATIGRSARGKLMSGEDVDLALCAHDLGLGTGRFVSLRMVHIIPKARFDPDYLARLFASIDEGGEVLNFLRNPDAPIPRTSLLERLRQALRISARRGLERRIYAARLRGIRDARRMLRQVAETRRHLPSGSSA